MNDKPDQPEKLPLAASPEYYKVVQDFSKQIEALATAYGTSLRGMAFSICFEGDEHDCSGYMGCTCAGCTTNVQVMMGQGILYALQENGGKTTCCPAADQVH